MLTEEIFTLLVFLSVSDYCAYTEWVEISQSNYYRKGFEQYGMRPPTGPPGVRPPAGAELSPALGQGIHNIHFESDNFGVTENYPNATIPTWKRRNKPKIQHKVIGNVVRVTTDMPEIVRLNEKLNDKFRKSDQENRNEETNTDMQEAARASGAPAGAARRCGSEQTVTEGETCNKSAIKKVEKAKQAAQNEAAIKHNLTDIPQKDDPKKKKFEENLKTSTQKPEEEDIKIKDVNNDENPTVQDKSNKSKFNTLAGIIKVLKLVQDTISKNSHRTLNSKTKYLRELRDTIMLNIEDRIEALWPSDAADAVGGRSRVGRSSKDGGHVDFPSAESTLMTISFLTFAVFLIKLVMQVIQTYKTKATMVTPVFAAMGRAAFVDTHQ